MFSKKINIPNEKAYYMLSYNIGLKICEINNFNGNTCLEYLKYVENKLLDWKNKDTEKRIKAEEERIKAEIKAEEEERLKKTSDRKSHLEFVAKELKLAEGGQANKHRLVFV